MPTLGIDGYKRGWVAVRLAEGVFAGADAAPRLADLLERHPDASIVGVDMPIGLLDAGWRDCDRAGREFLGNRRSTVFMTPPRPVIAAPSYDEANQQAREFLGQGISRQAYALRAKILEVDELAHDTRLHEVHPEISFQLLARRSLPSKRTWAGLTARIAALRKAGIQLPDDLGAAGSVPADDVLDAAAAAWSTERIARGCAQAIPERATQWDGDRGIRIWG